MTKKTLQLLATAALVAGFGFTTVTANAADTTETGSKTTTAKVSLTQKTVTPTDPDHPDTAGNIQLTQAPSLDFGSQELDGSANFTKTITEAPALSSDVQVVNPGATTGWNVQVKSTGMATADATPVALKGSKIVLTPGTATTTNKNADDSTDNTGAPTFSGAIKVDLSDGAYQPVASAAANGGVGTWDMPFTQAALDIAGSNVAGEYSGNLVWALTNAPTGMATDPAQTK